MLMPSKAAQSPGSRLRAARKAAGLSTGELGRRASELLGRAKPISASAVRNQENGTNGIPYSLLSAYANVLGQEVYNLFFGPEAVEGEKVARNATIDAAAEYISQDLFVPFIGEVSADWAEPEIGWAAPDTIKAFALHGMSSRTMSAYLVKDGTLEPSYCQGEIIIVDEVESSHLKSGDHVIVSTVLAGTAVFSLREITLVEDGKLLLVAAGARSQTAIDVSSAPIAIDGVVIATVRVRSRNGAPVPAPDLKAERI